jgi:hypothetical protein
MIPNYYFVLIKFRELIDTCNFPAVSKKVIFLPNEKHETNGLDFYIDLSVAPGATRPHTEFEYLTTILVNCVINSRENGCQKAMDAARVISQVFAANLARTNHGAKNAFHDQDGNAIYIKEAEPLPSIEENGFLRINVRITADIISKGK